jgi:hypothetical protein
MKKLLAILLLTSLIAGCATFRDNPTSFKEPSDYSNYVNLNGVNIACEALDSRIASKRQFNVDLNRIGVLPVRLIVRNTGPDEIKIDRAQVFGILNNGGMYNTLALHQSIDRITRSQAKRGAAGGALLGAVAGGALGAGMGAIAGGGDSFATATGAAMGGTFGAIAGGTVGADSIAAYIGESMWYLNWGDRVVHPGYLENGFIFLPKADYQKIEIGVYNIAKNKMEKVVISLK